MEINKEKKIIIIILCLLIIGAIISSIPRIINFIKIKQTKPNYQAVEMNIDSKFAAISKKYKAFADMFEQNEPVLIYGYTQGHLDSNQSEIFDKKLDKLIESEDIQFKIIPYKNWKITTNVIEDKYIDNNATCSMVTKEQERLEEYLSFINRCMTQACIINTKNNNYILIDRDAEFVIKTLKKEIEIIR